MSLLIVPCVISKGSVMLRKIFIVQIAILFAVNVPRCRNIDKELTPKLEMKAMRYVQKLVGSLSEYGIPDWSTNDCVVKDEISSASTVLLRLSIKIPLKSMLKNMLFIMMYGSSIKTNSKVHILFYKFFINFVYFLSKKWKKKYFW